MCEYMNIGEGKCKITKENCPYLYFCNKIKSYKINNTFPKNCKVKQDLEVPKGYYKVCFERRGYLYISVNNFIVTVLNPYETTPNFVKLTKLKSGNWKIREAI